MDYREFMSHAPADCQPTVITRESILEEGAKRRHKKVEELTEEEIKEEMKMFYDACASDMANVGCY